ncbi:hypothetical protein SAMN05660226_02771 [Parapedobacter luteus]|uniref:Sensory rhodopsin transducer n=1 Tax=Parapedobacter luteus TaxID=623280 RepID=A0A1T5DF38_9SPHI|nr:sensory rhodopsin transducer [Parapedobacter luteus]SKB70286.1 hypothetical protein SAMN05660226_02771 [Parapedobacter luteus]
MTNSNSHEPIAGYMRWVIPGGYIPLESHGPEPACTSRDELIILNTHAEEAQVSLHVYYADRDPVGPYHISVPAQRIQCFRCNDLIDPEAIPLETLYALVVSADRPITVQFKQHDFGTHHQANHTLTAYPVS